MLRCRNCTATFASLRCGRHLYQKLRCSKRKNCTATSKSLHCTKVALSCRFPAGFKPPRLGTHVSDLLIRFSWFWIGFRQGFAESGPDSRMWRQNARLAWPKGYTLTTSCPAITERSLRMLLVALMGFLPSRPPERQTLSLHVKKYVLQRSFIFLQSFGGSLGQVFWLGFLPRLQ